MGNINVSPPAVRSVARSVRNTVADATGNASHCADASQSAAQANPGWASSSALTDCANAWSQHVEGMVTEMGQLAEMLEASATSYSKVDAEAGARFQQILQEFAQNTWSPG
ncbi:MAG TPA: type VII secretion target [Pseudonocardiaceae bacterium]|nr:type VII secretion target [Pseudonocardiaceae bacterium]